MLKRPLPRALAGAVLCGLFLSACALADKIKTKQPPVESRPVLAEGDFEKALDDFKAAYEKTPRDKKLAAKYQGTVLEIKAIGDKAFGAKDFARAGGIYRILLDRYGDFGAFAATLPFKKVQLETAQKECRIMAVDNPAARAVKAGNFARALDIFQAALKESPGDAELAAKYRGTVLEIKAIGDKAFGAKDFAQAGRVNASLLRNYASFEGLKPPVAFSKEDLTKAVVACRENLTKTGLAEYRKGNLAKAIAVWEGLLAFDPDNAEIKKAVNTAWTQLDGIKKEQ